MIKGLYFKLNIDKMCDRDILVFFEKESKFQGISKIELLTRMMTAYFSRTEETFLCNHNESEPMEVKKQ